MKALRTLLAAGVAAVLLSGRIAAGATDGVPAEPPPEAAPASDSESHGEEFAPEDRAEEPDVPPDPAKAFDLFWKQGLNYQLRPLVLAPGRVAQYERHLALEGRIGTKLAGDAGGFFTAGTLPDIGTQAKLRRFFVYTTGEFRLVYPFLFKVEVGLIGDNPYVDSFWLAATDLPWLGTLTVGQFDAPMSFDVLTGSTNRSFMEQAAPVQALAPGQKVGIQVADFSDARRLSWQTGLFTDGQPQDVGDATNSPLRLLGRVVWRPLEDLARGDVLHVGTSGSYVLSSSDDVQYRTRPESYLAPTLLDTGDIAAKSVFLIGTELAAVRGSTSLQAEYLVSFVTARDVGDPILHGGYLLLSQFLTGETRPYERAIGTFGRLDPLHEFAPWRGPGWGAWEVAARISGADLDDGDVRGGSLWLLGGEVNWYWNRYVRLALNYELGSVSNRPEHGFLQFLQARVQLVI